MPAHTTIAGLTEGAPPGPRMAAPAFSALSHLGVIGLRKNREAVSNKFDGIPLTLWGLV